MTRETAETPWWHSLPPDLKSQAFIHEGQPAWPRAQAQQVLRLLSATRHNLLWAMVWVPLRNAFIIPMRCVYTWSPDPVSRDKVADAATWIRDFAWDRRDEVFHTREPFFHFSVSPALP